MNTPSRRALGDVRNQLLGTPGREFTKPGGELLKTPALTSKDTILRPTVSQPKFLNFDGDDFEVYSEEKLEEVHETIREEVNENVEGEYEPIESFDVCPEPPDRFEELLEYLKELEKIVLVDDSPTDHSYVPDFKLHCSSGYDSDFDPEDFTIVEPEY